MASNLGNNNKDPFCHFIGEPKKNKRVNWVVRLIPYDPTNEEGLSLSIGRLEKLGKEEQKFVFVADYDELRGYTVSQAVIKVGLSLDSRHKHVSAVIFPLLRRQLYPANARGVLQAIIDIENTVDINEEKRFNINGRLGDNAEKLNNKSISSYYWENIKDDYQDHCDLVYKFRCNGEVGNGDKYAATQMLGSIGADWHPLGFSKPSVIDDKCGAISKSYCTISGWDDNALVKDFGARIFLMENISINSIGGRYMIDFDNPSQQVIPDIGNVPSEE